MALIHKIVPKGVTAKKKPTQAATGFDEVFLEAVHSHLATEGHDICPHCGQRIRPKTDRKAYQREYQRKRRKAQKEQGK